ncbi:hypothetical protein LOSG293_320140 [Secundilactobacillus oryzae JCM 18671]|uniref:Integral membrane protein n=1 Tax=Secundilactobacillus oryzae JCM 18671 TaxID=1291743 RepID=A0A081BKB3_9LACO|nr:hypothetical protein [Secundilactobacillus oryzae]GAK48481.1 hypothetical protein LOSG293_320140 [Secundilactobacillus oryzae JCM 18671]
MQSNKRKLVLITVAAIVLFVVSNSLVFMFQAQQANTDVMIRSGVFVAVLYGWGLVRLLAGKRFAVPFMNFINSVYGMGFISNIALATTKLSGGIVPLVIILSLSGIVINIYDSILAKQFHQRQLALTD